MLCFTVYLSGHSKRQDSGEAGTLWTQLCRSAAKSQVQGQARKAVAWFGGAQSLGEMETRAGHPWDRG